MFDESNKRKNKKVRLNVNLPTKSIRFPWKTLGYLHKKNAR